MAEGLTYVKRMQRIKSTPTPSSPILLTPTPSSPIWCRRMHHLLKSMTKPQSRLVSRWMSGSLLWNQCFSTFLFFWIFMLLRKFWRHANMLEEKQQSTEFGILFVLTAVFNEEKSARRARPCFGVCVCVYVCVCVCVCVRVCGAFPIW